MLFVRRGYLLLLTGILVGFIVFSAISSIYTGSVSQRGSGEFPTAIDIDFLLTSEKQGWVEQVTPRFEEWFQETFNISITVRLIVTGTHDTVNRILDGSEKPTIWSPAASLWIPYMNTKWRNITGANYDLAVDWTPIALSPVVLTGWGSFLQDHEVSGFMDLYRLAEDGVDFKYGHPDPLLSNGGTMTVVLEFAEAAGKKPEDLTIDDLKNETVIDIVSTIESKSITYGKSTGFFGAWAAENGPSAIQFFGIYENVVIDNSVKALSKWNDPLIAIYPEQGTIMADHPFVILNASWIDPWQRFAAGQYLFYLLKPENQELSQIYGFRPASSSVPLDQSLFDPSNGVQFEIRVPVLKPLKGEVMEAMFTAWVRVRNTGI
ncbi:MAG: substrate-binding domain-containing protein [Candidatus Bathyarchaeota archaeon]|jgi:Ca-activated chloride channel family protein|nr:substrate-binding domain-containing protein [Candidatus Bathyarchaeota archaeon]